ncbi:MAG: glycosyltransferase family 4 protein [Bacteroidia bacterium]
MSKHRRILLCNFSAGWGGGELWFFFGGKSLKDRGFTVKWWVKKGSVLEERLKSEQLPYLTSSGRASEMFNPFSVSKNLKAIKAFSPDIMLLNASHELKLAGLLGKMAGVPHIIFRRGLSFSLKNNFLNQWYMRSVVTASLTNSKRTEAALCEVFPQLRQKPQAIIYNGIDLRNPPPAPNPEPGLILMSARLSPEKGIDRALRCMALLKANGINATLRILGRGPQGPELKALASELGVQNMVEFAGFVAHVPDELSRASLFLFTPVRGEGTSFALLEAMAAGLPCLAFESPSLDEVIVDGKTGYLLPPGDEAGMAEAIGRLLNDEDLRKQLGENSRKRAFEHFSLERLLNELLSFFNTLD